MSSTQGIKTWIIALAISIKKCSPRFVRTELYMLNLVESLNIYIFDSENCRTHIVPFILYSWNECLQQSFCHLWRKEMEKKKKKVVSGFVWLDRRRVACLSGVDRSNKQIERSRIGVFCVTSLAPHLFSYADLLVHWSSRLYIIL